MWPRPLTRCMAQSILAGMSNEDQSGETELDLKRLEIRVEELIRALRQLQEENSSLRSREDALISERASLIEKTELAKTRVESMITRLKSMETNL